MTEKLQRIHDKINYETNVVDPKTYYILLEAVKRNQPLTYEKGRDEVFPNARSDAGMRWDAEKRDTHASNVLEQYQLVNADKDRKLIVSDLGYKFLSCFDTEGQVVVSDYYKTVLLEMLISWVEFKNDRNIHPGRMLIKLMMDSELKYYQTHKEFAAWTSDDSIMTDSDYCKIKNLILKQRKSGEELNVNSKKSEVFLRSFASSWGLFDREIKDGIYYFTIKKDVIPLVDQFFIVRNEKETKTLEYPILNSVLPNRLKGKYNRIVFGAPGTGKSYRLEQDRKVFNNNYERVTFHPNYSYAQFVGTYKPVPIKEIKKDGIEVETITYKYIPGPFMRIYVKAMRSLKEMNLEPFLLIIEEINRANVTAVFGEVFQLLDRKDGESEYEIETSEDMRAHLKEKLGGDESEYMRIKIPSNMYIWATMNSADQGVFPMDTAFKRRWDFEYIGINENSDDIKDVIVKLGKGKYQYDVNWDKLRVAINDKLSIVSKVNEDKLLGPYFLSNSVMHKDDDFEEFNKRFIEAFKNKVIMYLYEDAAKQHKQSIFEGCDSSKYSSVCEAFEEIGIEIFGRDIKIEVLNE